MTDSKRAKVQWLLVGTGDIVRKRVAAALSATTDSRVVGVVGSSRARAEEIARQCGATQVFTDYQLALRDSPANAVYIASPVYQHGDRAVLALEAGKHVLVEKPLGLSADDADRVVSAARGRNLRAGCAYYRRCFPRYQHLQRMSAEGRFGKVVLVRMTYFGWFHPAADDPKLWRVRRSQSGGGPLADMGSHMFDQLIGLFGLPRRVFARIGTLVQDYEVEDSSAVVMELQNGAQVLASFGWNSKTWGHELEVVGSEAKITWRPADSGPVLMTVGRDTQELNLPNADNVHQPLVEDFVRAVIDGRDPIVTVAEAAKTNVLLDAIYQSAALGKEVLR